MSLTRIVLVVGCIWVAFLMIPDLVDRLAKQYGFSTAPWGMLSTIFQAIVIGVGVAFLFLGRSRNVR